MIRNRSSVGFEPRIQIQTFKGTIPERSPWKFPSRFHNPSRE